MGTNDWRVLLIGGNSGAGKTYLAKALVREWGIPFVMVDDVRIALHKVTSADQQPDLHVFLQYQAEQWKNPEGIVRDWQRVGQAMIKPLSTIMAHHIHVESSGPIILEGDGILPALAEPGTFDEMPAFKNINFTQKVRSVFVVEEDIDEILENIRSRKRGPVESKEETQFSFAQASQQYGQWLIQEAQRLQIPVLPTRPKETIVERLKQVI
jgi:2-phosphoglycerate kinase